MQMIEVGPWTSQKCASEICGAGMLARIFSESQADGGGYLAAAVKNNRRAGAYRKVHVAQCGISTPS